MASTAPNPSLRRLLRACRLRHPAQLVAVGFGALVAMGTALLCIPAATSDAGGAPVRTGLFTATSAVTTTGLASVDTATYWSGFGQVVILVLAQVGGVGILASASVLLLALARGLNLRGRLAIQLETGAADLGSLRRVLIGVVVLAVSVETAAATAIGLRLALGYGDSAGEAAWSGVFHAVMSFNNGGFSLYSGNLTRFVGDAWFLVPVMVASVAGALGFPVWTELVRERRTPGRWGLHTRLTLTGVAASLGAAAVLVTALEWSNGATLGGLSAPDRLLAGTFAGFMTSGGSGFNALDYAAIEPQTLLVSDVLMFVGMGSASTAGGIKVTTFALLILVVVSELRGRTDVTAFRRRVPPAALRQALAVTIVALAAVFVATLILVQDAGLELSAALFEATSAFGTVGLSTGVTGDLPTSGQLVLVVLMFLGRVGPLTLGVALILRDSQPRFRHPEERPIVG